MSLLGECDVQDNVTMHMFESEARVLRAAEELAATLGSDPNHSVAAAAMDTRGRVHVGVNMYHFTGGPCAELVVLGVAAAAGAGPLMTIAAAGDGGRGSIAPCGRCRQVLLDTHPDVDVIVPGESGPELKPIHELLPSTYRFPDASPRRVVRFNKRYFDEIAGGTKQLTTRYKDPIALGPAMLVFEDDDQFRTLDGMVDSIRSVRLEGLTKGDAQREGVESADLLRHGLRRHYPQLPDDAIVEVVEFHTL